jgi:hypothetical protein
MDSSGIVLAYINILEVTRGWGRGFCESGNESSNFIEDVSIFFHHLKKETILKKINDRMTDRKEKVREVKRRKKIRSAYIKP